MPKASFSFRLKSNGLPSYPCQKACKKYGPYGKEIAPGFFLQVSTTGRRGGRVKFDVRQPRNSWIGFSLGKAKMRGTDMVLFQNDENGVLSVSDRSGVGWREPAIDVK